MRNGVEFDFVQRLQEVNTDGDVFGVILEIMECLGVLWEDGRTELVATLVQHFRDVEDGGLTTAQSMSFQILRRYTLPYLHGDHIEVPPYWKELLVVAIRRMKEGATFLADPVEMTDVDEVHLMQVGGSRLSRAHESPGLDVLVSGSRPWVRVWTMLTRKVLNELGP